MFDSVMIWWSDLQPGIQAALVAACATIAAATIGAFVVARQLRAQAANALKQNKHNESLKLKLKVYEEIIKVCAEAQLSEVEFSSFIRSFVSEVGLYKSNQQFGQHYTLPRARFPQFSSLQSSLNKTTVGMISLTERWQIIDPRIEVFRTAINVAAHELQEAAWKYTMVVMPMMPVEQPGRQGEVFPWHPPNDAQFNELNQLSDAAIKAVDLLGSFTHDFQLEMQNLLIGELFGNSVPARVPIDPRYPVVRLDNHAMLEAYFARDTAWGQNRSKVEADVRAILAAQRLGSTESADAES